MTNASSHLSRCLLLCERLVAASALHGAAWTAYALCNALFVLKYGWRVGTTVGTVACLLYLAFTGALYGLFRTSVLTAYRRVFLVGSACVFVALLAVQLSLDPMTIQVDRWSAIHYFLDYLFSGRYPYSAPTHLDGHGSPFPVWQLLHVPFYLVRNVGLSLFAALLLLLHEVRRGYGRDACCRLAVLLLASPALAYEAVVRSDLVTNFIFVVYLLLLLQRNKWSLERRFWPLCVVIGLMMSTRLSLGAVFFVVFLADYLRLSAVRKVVFPVAVVAVFGLTFMPLLAVWGSDMFAQYSPFRLQTSQVHASDLLLFLPLMTVAALGHRSQMGLCLRAVGLLLVTIVAVSFVHSMWLYDTWQMLFESVYDISYFDMSLPFIATALAISPPQSCRPRLSLHRR